MDIQDSFSLTTYGICLLLLAGLIAYVWWRYLAERLAFGLKVLWWRCPVIGPLARLQRPGANLAPSPLGSSILSAEEILVQSFLSDIEDNVSEQEHQNAADYVKKAQDGETRRVPLPLLLTMVTAGVALEGLFGGFIVADYLFGEFSAELLPVFSVLVAVAIAAGIGGAGHVGGIYLRRALHTRRQRRAYAMSGYKGEWNPPRIGLGDPQHIDNQAPPHQHFGSRARRTPLWVALPWCAVPFILLALIGLLRHEGYAERNAAQAEHQARVAALEHDDNPVVAAGKTLVEVTLTVAQKLATILFFVVGAVLALLGILCGMQHSVNGEYTEAAHDTLGPYTTFQQRVRARWLRLTKVETLFSILQQGLQVNRPYRPDLHTVMRAIISRRDNTRAPHPESVPPAGKVVDIKPSQS